MRCLHTLLQLPEFTRCVDSSACCPLKLEDGAFSIVCLKPLQSAIVLTRLPLCFLPFSSLQMSQASLLRLCFHTTLVFPASRLFTFLSFFFPSLHQAKWLLMNSSGLPPAAGVRHIDSPPAPFLPPLLTFRCYLHRKPSINPFNPESCSSLICLSVSLTPTRQSTPLKQGINENYWRTFIFGFRFPSFPKKSPNSSVCKLAIFLALG